MASTILSYTSLNFQEHKITQHRIPSSLCFRPDNFRQSYKFRCSGENSTDNTSTSSSSTNSQDSENNVLLKVAWYSSELLGIAASVFRPPSKNVQVPSSGRELSGDGSGGAVDRAMVVETIKDDFKRSYFVTGAVTVEAYEEDCEFADPAGSFKGLSRFKRNCTNFGLLIEKSDMKLTKWENLEDKGIGHWRFSCIMSFPWKPILSATGFTEYYFDAQSGRVNRHVEHWNVPKMALLKQLLKPSKGSGTKKTVDG
ncbi:CAAX prenyl protease 1-like protein [Heracleum sosnowskyi]|uniref:CAAX prenyl protease 1-like protein n=1 Tax=Heracleum sosnowskyi TaxID=360622 RepID=A0AAD8M995_9APIA|nr:CAAX prenyl protease 1-like protein [Heracleum sosnowskyi]